MEALKEFKKLLVSSLISISVISALKLSIKLHSYPTSEALLMFSLIDSISMDDIGGESHTAQ